MPYRIDLRDPPVDALERLVALGAVDVDALPSGIAAIMPDSIEPCDIARALGSDLRVTPAQGRDDGSVWVVNPRHVHVGRFHIIPANQPPQPGAVRLVDGPAFGTGLHHTTALCLESLDAELSAWSPDRVLDVGTGSGILALAALCAGVPRAVAIDIDDDAVRVAAENARLNGLSTRVALMQGGVDALRGAWPLVLANVLAAPLVEMAPLLTQRVASKGRVVLSGIRWSLAPEVEHAYRRLGMQQVGTHTREGWTTVTFRATW